MYIVKENINIERLSLPELCDRVRDDMPPYKDGCDGWASINTSKGALAMCRVGYSENYPETNEDVHWVFVTNQNKEYKPYDEVVKDPNIGLWLAADRRFSPFKSVLFKLATLKVGNSSDISDAVANGLEEDGQIPEGRDLYQCLNDWEDINDPEKFGLTNDGAYWVPVKLEIKTLIDNSPIFTVSRKLRAAEVDDSLAKKPGFLSVFSRKNKIFSNLFINDRKLTDREAYEIITAIGGWGERLKTGAGVIMAVCKSENADNEVSTAVQNDQLLSTSKYHDSAVITQKAYEVLSIDKHEDLWNLSLRDLTSKQVFAARLVFSAVEGGADNLRNTLSMAFSQDSSVKLEVLEGRIRNLILRDCSASSPENDGDEFSDHSTSSPQSGRFFDSQRSKNEVEIVQDNDDVRDIDDYGYYDADYVCVQRFTVNILKKRTAINDDGLIIPDRLGGKMRTVYKVGYSSCVPDNYDEIAWTHVVTQEGKVFNLEYLDDDALAEMTGRVHRGLNHIYANLMRVHPEDYDLDEAIYDGLGDDSVFDELERKLYQEDKEPDFPSAQEFSDEIRLESTYLDRIISEDLYTAYYNVHCAQLNSSTEVGNPVAHLESGDSERVLKFVETASEDFCDGEGLEWIAVVGLAESE